MSIAEFSRKIELHFWDWAIPTLSASRMMQVGVRFSYRFLRIAKRLRWYWIGFLVSILGFSNGVLVFQILTR
jgi:hypothetical protein